ncbi:MAG TPA: hypothetical protein VFF17_10825 [Thermoanaerobaculia bacterium]|nr:hypothetical protein [Thermoanaerobaculia bacterium]
MSATAWTLAGAALLVLAVFALPRLFLSRAQDKLAKATIARDGAALKLLTRAELVVGRFRRIPGLLAWRDDVLAFQGIFGSERNIPPARIEKIVTANRLANGRLLVRLEVLRLTATDGEEIEFVLERNTVDAWRRLLGEWAGRERAAALDLVTPGRSKP